MNDETIIQGPSMNRAEMGNKPIEKPVAKKKSSLRDILLSVGSMAGGAGLTFATQGFIHAATLPGDETGEQSELAALTPEPVIYPEAPVATSVNDSMTFGEAFAAARHEVGAGGVFEYQGNVYNTYYAEEWNQLSPEQRNEFAQSVDLIATSETVDSNYMQDNEQPIPPAADDAITQEPAVIPEPEPPAEPAVDIIAVETDELGNTYIAADTNQNEIPDVYMADIDADGIVDALIIDANEDMEPDEILDVTSENIAVTDILQSGQTEIVQPEERIGLDDPTMPDYMNDADVSELS
jgi:hypothetical protein